MWYGNSDDRQPFGGYAPAPTTPAPTTPAKPPPPTMTPSPPPPSKPPQPATPAPAPKPAAAPRPVSKPNVPSSGRYNYAELMAGNPEVIAWKEAGLKNYMDWTGASRQEALDFLGWLSEQNGNRGNAFFDVRFAPLNEQLAYGAKGGHWMRDPGRKGLYYNNGADGRTFTWKTKDGRDVPSMEGVYPTNFREGGRLPGFPPLGSGSGSLSVPAPPSPAASAAATSPNLDIASLLRASSPASAYLGGLAAWRPDMGWRLD